MSNKYLSTALIAGLIVAIMLSLFGQRSVTAQQPVVVGDEIVRTVSVSGTGVVSAVPDQATIDIGVRTEGKTSEEALEENNDKMDALLASLKRAKILSKDIQTRDFSIWPQYRESSSGTTRITGYEVSNTVVITVRDIENLGQTLDAAVKAGSNQVNGIRFGFSDPAALLDQARENAMKDAKRKATELAQLADVELGTVVTISESGSAPRPVFRGAAESFDQAASVAIEAGESSLSQSIQVTYELVTSNQ
ncbi:MAG: SIMPL domain-containing protein [Ardenticatenaceae bacterium]